MDFYDIPRVLKRYSFEEKMRVLNYYSRQLIEVQGNISTDKLIKGPYPWELETILLFSLKATPEYADNDFIGKNINRFIEMINLVRNFQHPLLIEQSGNDNFANYLITTFGLNQFHTQEFLPYKYYRYSYIFNFENEKLNMKQIFYEYFDISYKDFLAFISMLNVLFSSCKEIDNKVLNSIIFNVYPKVYKQLFVTVEEHNCELDKITQMQEDYLYCLRPTYKYPFILNNNKVYIPLPHLLGKSITSSLLYRLAEGNNELRTIFGKEVLENYMYDLLNNSLVYDEVIKEKKYIGRYKCEDRTLDVMVRENNKFLLIDCKSTVPNIGVRVFDELSFNKMIEILVKSIIQVYNNITKKFLIEYNFFTVKKNIDINNVYGAVVVLEDSYINRDLLYRKAADKLKIDIESDQYKWFINHIKLANLYDVEKYSLVGCSIIEGFEKQRTEGNYSDYPLINISSGKKEIKNIDYLDFKEKWIKSVNGITMLMQKDGIIA